MTAQVLRAQFEEDLANLQNLCPHTEVSGWVPYSWAPGHIGLPVRYCLVCEKIMERQEFTPQDKHGFAQDGFNTAPMGESLTP